MNRTMRCVHCRRRFVPNPRAKTQRFQIPPDLVVKGYHHSAQASGGEDLEVEHPVVYRYSSAFHFHATLANVLGPALIRHQIVQVGESRQKRPLAAAGVMKAFHGK